jgi:methyl-accepting chemotaxis protein
VAATARDTEALDARAAVDTSATIRRVVQRMDEAVGAMQDSAQRLRTDADAVSVQIEQLHVDLQFQDRLNQVLGSVRDDVDRLHGVLDGPGPVPDPAAWLAALEAGYAMHEQRANHRAGAPAAGPQAGTGPVTFF